MHRTKFKINAYLAFAVVTAVLLGFVIVFFAKLPHYSETYRGTLSSNVYRSVEQAARAYLSEEVDSDSSKSTFVSCSFVKTLSRKQVEEVDFEETFDEVEQIEVTYRLDDKTYHVKIYSCYLENNGYKYFSPPPYVGENITKSYYDSVLSSSDVLNCTLNLQATSAIKILGIPLKGTVNYQMKISDGIAYYNEHSSLLGSTVQREVYAFDGNHEVVGIVKQYEKIKNLQTGETTENFQDWTNAEILLPFGQPKRVSEFSLFGLYEGMDHTFFEKTKTGFAAKRSRSKEFSEIVKKNLAERIMYFETGSDDIDEMINRVLSKLELEFNCNYVVEDGHLRQAFLKQKVDYGKADWRDLFGDEAPDWAVDLIKSISIESSYICDIVNIGTTQFTIPSDAQERIDQMRKYLFD